MNKNKVTLLSENNLKELYAIINRHNNNNINKNNNNEEIIIPVILLIMKIKKLEILWLMI